MKTLNQFLFTLIVVLLAACGGSSKYDDGNAGYDMGDASENIPAETNVILSGLALDGKILRTSDESLKDNDILKQDVAKEEDGDAQHTNTRRHQNIERKVIKEGHLVFETEDMKATDQHIKQLIKQFDAYIGNENAYNYSYRLEQQIVIRVPAQHFDTLIAMIGTGVEHFDRKQIDVKDVTEEYLDVASRIKTKKELEERYRQLLSRANTVNEILEIEHQIGALRTEIESAEGRMRYLQNKIGYSTLNVNFYKQLSTPMGFGSKFGEGFENGWNNLVYFILGLVNIWPFLILLGVMIWLLKRWWKKRNRQKATK